MLYSLVLDSATRFPRTQRWRSGTSGCATHSHCSGEAAFVPLRCCPTTDHHLTCCGPTGWHQDRAVVSVLDERGCGSRWVFRRDFHRDILCPTSPASKMCPCLICLNPLVKLSSPLGSGWAQQGPDQLLLPAAGIRVLELPANPSPWLSHGR